MTRSKRLIPAAGLAVAASLALAPMASAQDWSELAQCESSGNWHINTGNGFYGGLQFTESTWAAFGGHAYAPNAHLATRAQQIAIAERVLEVQGPGAWPACSAKTSWETGTSVGSAPTSVPVVKTAPEPTQPQESGSVSGETYTVQPGDTLSKIAQRFGTDWRSLFNKNLEVLNDPHLIFPGQVLNT